MRNPFQTTILVILIALLGTACESKWEPTEFNTTAIEIRNTKEAWDILSEMYVKTYVNYKCYLGDTTLSSFETNSAGYTVERKTKAPMIVNKRAPLEKILKKKSEKNKARLYYNAGKKYYAVYVQYVNLCDLFESKSVYMTDDKDQAVKVALAIDYLLKN